MSTNLDYLKSDAKAMLNRVRPHFQQLEADVGLRGIRGAAQETQEQMAQDEAAQPYEEQGQELNNVMLEVESQFEDVKLKQKFNSVLYDEANRKAFGAPSDEKAPKSMRAAQKLYGDALYAQYITTDFENHLGENTVTTINAKTHGARTALKEAYLQNNGGTDEEAEQYVTDIFGPVEDQVKLHRTATKAKQTIKAGAGKVAGAVGENILKMLSYFEIIDAPFREAGMEYANVAHMDAETFQERYPKEGKELARLLQLEQQEELKAKEKKEKNWLINSLRNNPEMKKFQYRASDFLKEQKAFQASVKAGFKEANRILVSGDYDPRVLNEFVATVTDDPQKQTLLKQVMPWATIAPIVALELTAVRRAREIPAYAFRALKSERALDAVLDVVVPGRPNAWKAKGHVLNAAQQEALKAANTKAATGEIPVEKIEEETVEIVKNIASGDLTDQTTRKAAAHVVKRTVERAGDQVDEGTQEAVETLRSQIKQADAQAKADAGKSVPSEEVVFRAAEQSDGSTAAARLGYDTAVFSKLIKNDKELQQFNRFYKEGLETADNTAVDEYFTNKFGPKGGAAPEVTQGIARDREEHALLYALLRFSKLHGRSFRDVAAPTVSPGSFAEFVPETGLLRLRRQPNRYMDMHPAPAEVEEFFFGVEGAKDWTKTAHQLKQLVAEGKTDIAPAERLPMMLDDVEVVGVKAEDYVEMGEIFRIPAEEGVTLQEYQSLVNNAFVNRFGATAEEVATGKNFFKDATVELKTPFHPAQVAKVEEIVNTWRGLKWLMKQAAGTDMEENAVNLALWYRSQIANGGTSYRLIHARTESFNRAARGQANGTTWGGSPRPTDYRATELPDKTYLKGEGGLLRSALDDDQGVVRTKLSPEEEASGQIFAPDDKTPGMAGSKTFTRPDPTNVAGPAKVLEHGEHQPPLQGPTGPARQEGHLVPGKDTNRSSAKYRTGQEHGADHPDSLAVSSDDAMANARSLDDVLRDSNDAYADTGQLSSRKTAEARAATLEEARLYKQGPEGPVNAATHSLEGSFEDLYVLDLEEFAGVSATAREIAKEGKLNVFHVTPEHINQLGKEIDADKFINEQLAGMAKRITTQEPSEDHLLLFHRSMAIAKGLREVKSTGAMSAATESWLKNFDLRAGATGATNEEAIFAGMNAARQEYGFMFNMQKNRKQVHDFRMAELFDSYTSKVGRERFIDEYATAMTGENALRMRREVNKWIKDIRGKLGGAC